MSRIIDTNLNRFRQSANEAIKLLLTCFAPSKNVLCLTDSKVFINNIEQILDKSQYKFDYGFQFVLDNVISFRNEFCVNPVLYLLFLKNLLNKKTNWRDLEKYSFKDFLSFLNGYKQNSSFSQVKLTLDDIFNILNEKDLVKDDSGFLQKVVEKAYSYNNTIIIEDKINSIEADPYYSLKAFFYSKTPIMVRTKVLLWEDTFTQENLEFFRDYTYKTQEKLVLVVNNISKEVKENIKNLVIYNDLLSFIHIPSQYFLKYTEDLKLLSGAQITLFNPNYDNLQSYIFGYLDTVFKEEEQVKILGSQKLLSTDKRLDYLRKNPERLSNVLGSTYKIKVVPELLEKVRTLVSFSKGIHKEGVFFNEVQTLNLIKIYLNKKVYTDLINSVLKEYLELFGVSPLDIEKVLNQKNFRQSFNPIEKRFQENSLFSSFTYYILTFKLLDSNLEVLKSLV